MVYQHNTTSNDHNEEYEHHVDTRIEDIIIKYNNLNVKKSTQKCTRLTTFQ